MQDDAPLITIGALARLTGLPVRTLRFYSDSGLVAPAGRSDAGYRLYDAAAPVRVELVRALRELGVDLPTIRRVLDRELSVAGVARAHAAALDAQIRVLRLQRAVLQVAAARDTTPERMKLMHDLARLGAEERRSIVSDFVDEVFADLDAEPSIAARMRMATPELPDDPTTEQVEAWIELAELVRDEDFRRRIRAMAQRSAQERAAAPAAGAEGAERAERAAPAAAGAEGASVPAAGAEGASVPAAAAASAEGASAAAAGAEREAHERVAAAVAERAGAALAAGIAPTSEEARPIVDELAGMFAQLHGSEDEPPFRAWLADTLGVFTDRRAERYWTLLGIMNGWPQRPSSTPAWEWLLAGLRA